MSSRIVYFRPGIEARILARLQFELGRDGTCHAIMTYPIPGHPWRRNPVRRYLFRLPPAEAVLVFDEVEAMPEKYPAQCLERDVLLSDISEKANSIVRHARSNKPCHVITRYTETGDMNLHFGLEEDSAALRESRLLRMVTTLIAPYETLRPNGGTAGVVPGFSRPTATTTTPEATSGDFAAPPSTGIDG